MGGEAAAAKRGERRRDLVEVDACRRLADGGEADLLWLPDKGEGRRGRELGKSASKKLGDALHALELSAPSSKV